MSDTTPLRPISENTNLPNSSRPTPQSKILSSPNLLKTPKTPLSPSRLPFSASVSKMSHSSVTSSPFFSSPPARGERGESPSKMSDFELIGDDELYAGVGDDTVSSTFSDVPIGQYGQDTAARGNSVKRSAGKRPQTPPTKRHQTTSVAATPTPRTNSARPISRGSYQSSPKSPEEITPRPNNNDQTSNLLLDFTTQFNAISSHSRNQTPATPSHRRTRSASPNKQASPSKFPLPPSTPAESRFFDLLDFSPGPLATPRSIPSITPREVESLKASFQSQISQLKAELSGREVEITGLRGAVRESEDRCADMTHAMKELEARLQEERDNWRNVRNELGELFEAEKVEKETLRVECEKQETELRMLRERAEVTVRELAEAKHRVDTAEEEAANAREEAKEAKEAAGLRPSTPSATTAAPTSPSNGANVQAEVEKVARELHSLYKAKHESKVAALKKSYESRWEKKVGQLQAELEAEKRKNEELQTQVAEKGAEDMTGEIGFSPARPVSSSSPVNEELKEELARLKTEFSIVQSELDTERREKGELVGAVEELLAIQAGPDGGQGQQAQVETEKVKKRVARVSGVGLPSGMTGGGFQGGLKSGIARMGGGGARDKN